MSDISIIISSFGLEAVVKVFCFHINCGLTATYIRIFGNFKNVKNIFSYNYLGKLAFVYKLDFVYFNRV